MKIIRNYSEFINEASLYEMRIGDYVLCNSNFRNISKVKGLYAKIIKREYIAKEYKTVKYFTLEFEIPLIDKTSGVELVTNTIKISQNQIVNLKHIKAIDYLRIKEGYTMEFKSSYVFEKIIKSINFKNAYKTYDMSYFDCDGVFITYLPFNKNEAVSKEEKYTSKLRQSSKVGRILKKLNDKYTEKEIEDFSNKFIGTYKILKENIDERLFVVTGDDITFWYDEINYLKAGGTLNSSCMRGSDKKNRLSLYSKYPDKIALCILIDENKKLCARALIWRLDNGEIFMDRIYYVSPIHEVVLLNYAKQNNIKTKNEGYNNSKRLEVSIDITDKDWLNRPYLDTFKFYNSINKKITNI